MLIFTPNFVYTALLSSWLFFVAFYLLSLKYQDMSIIDVAWGPSFLTILGSSLYFSPKALSLKSSLFSAIILIWALRLGIYLFNRWKAKEQEDFRYREFRNSWQGSIAFNSFTRVFMLQWLLMLLISSPIYSLLLSPGEREFSTLNIIGLLISLTGLIIESLSDYQLTQFKSKSQNKGKIMNRGLWFYSRHPNYFGEAVFWWGLYLFSITTNTSLWTIISPLCITILLTRISGVPMLEKKYRHNESYKKYIQTTNSFIPWFPKSERPYDI